MSRRCPEIWKNTAWFCWSSNSSMSAWALGRSSELFLGSSVSPPPSQRGFLVAVRRLGWLGVTGFLLNGNWEWLQTPFYQDAAKSVNDIVWFRLHCTVGDVLILLACALAVTGLRRSTSWLARPRILDFALMTALGLAYTSFSELVNLGRGTWAYSELMPLVPGTPVGLAPLAQWLVLPTAAVWFAARLSRTLPE